MAEQIRRRFAGGAPAMASVLRRPLRLERPGRPQRYRTWGPMPSVPRRTPPKPWGWPPRSVQRRSAKRLAGSSPACPTEVRAALRKLPPVGRISPGHSGRAFSHRAFLARSSVIFRPVWRAPTAELRAALPLALTVQATRLVPLTARCETGCAGAKMPVRLRMQGCRPACRLDTCCNFTHGPVVSWPAHWSLLCSPCRRPTTPASFSDSSGGAVRCATAPPSETTG